MMYVFHKEGFSGIVDYIVVRDNNVFGVTDEDEEVGLGITVELVLQWIDDGTYLIVTEDNLPSYKLQLELERR